MDTIRDETVPDKPRPRGLRVALVVFVILALLGGAAAVAYRPGLDWWIRREALKRGFELDFTEFSVVPDRVVFQRAHVRMVGVKNIDVRSDELTVDLQDMEPLRIDAKGATVEVTGSPDELQPMIVSFSKDHPNATRLPLSLTGTFSYGDRDNPTVGFTGEVKSAGDGDVSFAGTFRSRQTNLGTLALHRSKDLKIDAGFGLTISEKPIVTVQLDASAVPFKGTVTFASQKVDDVCRNLSLPVPNGLAGSLVEGTISFVLDGSLPSNPYHGTAAFVVTGWVPPHPRELDGIVFGKTTKLGTTFELMPDLSELKFPKATVDAGALHLEGKGNAVRDGLSARTKMDLAGNVACSELGASAIGSHVPGFVGDILRHVTRRTVGGVVNIRVQVDADTNSISNAKVDQAVDIGCRLR